MPRTTTFTSTTARELTGVVGTIGLEILRDHHVELITAPAELARNADMDRPWSHDDPTIAFLAVALPARSRSWSWRGSRGR